MIQEERVKRLNRNPPTGGAYVLYWMQASQRAECNHALEYAIARANELKLPLLAFFGLTEKYPQANLRHYRFMLEGLREARSSLAERGIRLLVRRQSPEKGVVELSRNASLVVVDRGYLRLQRQWRAYAAKRVACPLIQVEGDAVVPVEEASTREEYSAATLRPKIRRLLDRYLAPLAEDQPARSSLHLDVEGGDGPLGGGRPGEEAPIRTVDLSDLGKVLSGLKIDRGAGEVSGVRGGTAVARKRLAAFIDRRLELYAERRNDPSLDCSSGLSPYLHFGQISPLHVALAVREAGGPGADAFLEELIVRRELSLNFVLYNPAYDSLRGLPAWAQATLREHAEDQREYLYTLPELEEARTHDAAWNAAQKELLATGRMHNYMRMYWGKKIIEWSRTPQEAHQAAVYLNDKYELDGRDPNGYAGVLWCFGKHDRAWKERPVTGKLRYMSAQGLRRKFDLDAYLRRVENLAHP